MNHLKGSMEFWYYQSGPNVWHEPRTLEDGIEEIEVIVSGRGYFELADGSVIDAGPGSNLWYYPGDTVVVTSHERNPYETIVFRFHIKKPPTEWIQRYTIWQNTGECTRFSRAALALYKTAATLSPEDVYCWYARLVGETRTYLRQVHQENLPESLRIAVDFVMENYRADISVDEIAGHAGVSASHLHMLFRTHLKVSPMQYVIRQKLHMACELLDNNKLSVKEVCYQSGFNDVKYFISKFRDVIGQTPGQYAKRLKPVN